ncbi:hypothetical protein ACXET9_12670 [Brachybacterium sp. DNPG3]
MLAVACGIALFFLFRSAYRSMRTKLSQFRTRRAELKALRAQQIAAGERVSALQALRNLSAGLSAGAAPYAAAGRDAYGRWRGPSAGATPMAQGPCPVPEQAQPPYGTSGGEK